MLIIWAAIRAAAAPAPAGNSLLLETGDVLLMETGDEILLES